MEVETGRPIYVHRKGSNVIHGSYYWNYADDHLLSHYGGKTRISIENLKQEYARLSALSSEEVTENSPLKIGEFKGEGTPQKFYDLNRESFDRIPDPSQLQELIQSLDSQNRWLTLHGMTSNPYLGDGTKEEPTDEYSSTHVGDETDTSPFRDTTDQEYLSTGVYISNMRLLINYLETTK